MFYLSFSLQTTVVFDSSLLIILTLLLSILIIHISKTMITFSVNLNEVSDMKQFC